MRRRDSVPSVLLWAVSLNETELPAEFIARTHAMAMEEYPGAQCYTCRWVPGYDVLIRARQHGECPPAGGHPCVVSEYGDWEYHAMPAGLDQDAWKGLTPDESDSRQLRWHGERALLQQASNFQDAHNGNRAGAAFADGLRVMYDCNRGYAPDIESSGCSVPTYAFQFFRSQRPPQERSSHGAPDPMVFIASSWTPASSTSVRIFSNGDEVQLRLDGRVVGRRISRRPRHRRTLRAAVHHRWQPARPSLDALHGRGRRGELTPRRRDRPGSHRGLAGRACGEVPHPRQRCAGHPRVVPARMTARGPRRHQVGSCCSSWSTSAAGTGRENR